MTDRLDAQLTAIKLPYVREHYQQCAQVAITKGLGHIDYLDMLIEGEADQPRERAVERRLRQARFPYVKDLDQFQFSHPKKIDRMKVQHLFKLHFIKDCANVILVGGCGLGKTHLAIALGYHACVSGLRVLFTTAIDMINTLAGAQADHRLDAELTRYTKPHVLVIDELGYLPIDKFGADLLFQVISARYERGSIVLTTNRVFKEWAGIFNDDATLTSAVLDRLLHHHEIVVVEGDSYRMRQPNNG